MGGAQAVTLATAFVRSKLIALTIGPAGIGLMGVFNAFNSNLAAIAGWGTATSVVRTVAGAPVAEKSRKEAAVRHFGRRLAWLSFFGVLVVVLPIGQLTFESQRYAAELLIAGLAVPCMVATGIWTALLQASGQVGAMARAQVAGGVLGLLAGLPFICYFGTLGIALAILFGAVAAAWVTWRAAARAVPPTEAAVNPVDLRELLHLGVIFQIGGVLGAVATYAVRVLILRSHGADQAAGLADAGFYQAAFAVTGSLPGVIFSASSSDFYPRVAAARDEQEARHITEKQVQASLLLAMPVLVALLTMGPLAIRFLYARGFEPAVPLLDWFVWSIFANMLGWPLGFWVVARRSKRTVAVFQALVSLLVLLLAFLLVPWFGVKGAAIAQFGSAAFYAGVLLVFTRRIAGEWLGAQTCLWLAAAAAVLGGSRWLMGFVASPYWGLIPTLLTTSLCMVIYLKVITRAREAGELA